MTELRPLSWAEKSRVAHLRRAPEQEVFVEDAAALLRARAVDATLRGRLVRDPLGGSALLGAQEDARRRLLAPSRPAWWATGSWRQRRSAPRRSRARRSRWDR